MYTSPANFAIPVTTTPETDRDATLIDKALRFFIAHKLQASNDPQAEADAESAAVLLFRHQINADDMVVDLTNLS